MDVFPGSQFPWYDAHGLSSQGAAGDGLLYGMEFLNGERDIAMSDSPRPIFLLDHPSPGGNALQSAAWNWTFELIVAVGTIDAANEERPLPPGPRYPFFRRAELNWSYAGTITFENGQHMLSNSSVVSQGMALTKVQNGDLAFDTDVRRYLSNGEPIIANTAINNGEGQNGPWVY